MLYLRQRDKGEEVMFIDSTGLIFLMVLIICIGLFLYLTRPRKVKGYMEIGGYRQVPLSRYKKTRGENENE
jgi:hypothetical protein